MVVCLKVYSYYYSTLVIKNSSDFLSGSRRNGVEYWAIFDWISSQKREF